ncbi:MAG: hypothetical protein WCD86_02320 [Ktedonobacteraceae bacterium]
MLNRQQQRDGISYSPQEPALPAYVATAQQAQPSVQSLHVTIYDDASALSLPPAKGKPDISVPEDDLSHLMPESWSELALDVVDASGNVPVADIEAVDPLRQRRLPMGSGSQNAKPAHAAEPPQQPDDAPDTFERREATNLQERALKIRRRGFSRLHKILAFFMMMAVLALIVDGVLLALNFSHHRNASASASLSLSVTPSVVQRGQMALLHLAHFSAHTSVFLTHDIQQMLLTDTGSSLVQLGASGAASVPVLIEPDWSLGAHTIEAEDVTTRYTISTTIEVINGEGYTPLCSVTASKANLAFTVTAGQALPVAQPITLSAGNCALSERWQAASFASWLTVSPSSGQLAPGSNVPATVQVNGSGLTTGTLSSYVAFTSMQHTQLVTVRLTVLPGSSSSVPGQQPTPTGTTSASASYTLSPIDLNFTATQGQPDLAGQIVTITDTGSTAIDWQAAPIGANWLSVSPQQNILQANQSTQVIVSVNAAQLSTGRYAARLQVSATGSSGGSSSQQFVSVNVNVLAPCTLHISPSGLAYAATTLQEITGPQTITVAEAGNCTQTVFWKVSVDRTWVSLSSSSGSNGGTITASINKLLPLPGTYNARITFSATSGGSAVQVSPQSVLVTLTVKLL